MSKFVSDQKIACVQPADGPCLALAYDAFLAYRRDLPEHERDALNVIWIPAKMGFKRQRLVMDALIEVETGSRGMGLNFGAHQIALLQHNILSWEGPDFAGVPLTQKHVDELDPDDDLVAFALAEIGRRNPRKPSPDPKSAGASGSLAAGAPPSTAS